MSTMYKCMIVEDEPLARQVLEKYIDGHPCLELVAVCNDALEAQRVLLQQPVALVFLDINLPRLSGISFLKGLVQPPCIVFTTAYAEYAVEGFELDAADYLLKPFSFERFLKAVNKAIARLDNRQARPSNDVPPAIFIRSDKKVYRLNIEDILYIEALDDYAKVMTGQAQYLVNDTLKSLSEQLPDTHFLRIHKSYIIAKERIVFIEGNYVRVGDKDVPIGASYRDAVQGLIGTDQHRKKK
ncbi:LytTR family DNA-binding domain-containing protein [uncultured Chitinophaga sp.]|uniref:LytR/AlgR family response regulator transcription factor n=1 Tax=uncultured Chitinophaga sp. TaxID=339340 RepID=UPI0025D8F455|nr:LytTR family DNA-binding domain-containing protein [uncultured Chitinophaga sp.]